MVPLVLMLVVVAVVGFIVDFVVVVDDDDISVLFFQDNHHHYPLPNRIQCNFSTPVQLYPTRSTQPNQFQSNRPFPLYYTNHSLPHRFRSTPPKSHYPAHPALPRPPHIIPSKMLKKNVKTRTKKHSRQLYQLHWHDLSSDDSGGVIIINK